MYETLYVVLSAAWCQYLEILRAKRRAQDDVDLGDRMDWKTMRSRIRIHCHQVKHYSAVPRLVRGIQRSKLRVTFLDPADEPRDGGTLQLALFTSLYYSDLRRPERVFWREGSPNIGTMLRSGDPSRQKTRSGRRGSG